MGSIYHIEFTGKVLAGIECVARQECTTRQQVIYEKVLSYADRHLFMLHSELRQCLQRVERKDLTGVIDEKTRIESYLRERFLEPLAWIQEDLRARMRCVYDEKSPVQIRGYLDLCAGLRKSFVKHTPLTHADRPSKPKYHMGELVLPDMYWHFINTRGTSLSKGLITVVSESLFMPVALRERKIVGMLADDLLLLSQALRKPCPIFFQLAEYAQKPGTYYLTPILQEQCLWLETALKKYEQRRRAEACACIEYAYLLSL